MRYAENLVEGRGLVFNEGEFVEGYTTLSWTLLLALFIRLGVDPVSAAQGLGILFYLGLVGGLLYWAGYRTRTTGPPWLPLAALLVLILDDFHEWATGGLETMMFASLALWGLILTRMPAAGCRGPLAAGLCFALLTLTRLDGILIAGIGVLSWWIPWAPANWRKSLNQSILAGLPVAVTVAVWFAFKLAYYGDPFPTAYYSKSAADAYWSQGLTYLGLYVLKNWFIVGGVAAGWMLRKSSTGRGSRGDTAVFLGAGLLYLLYVTHSGGDFMFARRIVVVAPLFFLCFEEVVRRLPRIQYRLIACVLFVVAAACSIPVFSDARPRVRRVSDERRFYPAEFLAIRKTQAEVLASAFRGADVRIGFEGGMLMFAYYSKLPYLAEMTGLTQYSLAKRPIARRGLPGHEKAPDRHWFEENRIHLLVRQLVPQEIQAEEGTRPYNDLRFGEMVKAEILIYEDAIMDPLRQFPGVAFLPMDSLVVQASENFHAADIDESERFLEQLRGYYFDHAGEEGKASAEALQSILDQRRGMESPGPRIPRGDG